MKISIYMVALALPLLAQQGVNNSDGYRGALFADLSWDGTVGGYVQVPNIGYGGTCFDQWNNPVSIPAAVPGMPTFDEKTTVTYYGGGSVTLPFDGHIWVSPSPGPGVKNLSSAVPCGNPLPPPQNVTGINTDVYLLSTQGLATTASAYNSIDSLTGGLNLGQSATIGEAVFMGTVPATGGGGPTICPTEGSGATGAVNTVGSAGSAATFTVSAGGAHYHGTVLAYIVSAGNGRGFYGLATISGGGAITGIASGFQPGSGYASGDALAFVPLVAPSDIAGCYPAAPFAANYGAFGYNANDAFWWYNSTTSTWAKIDFLNPSFNSISSYQTAAGGTGPNVIQIGSIGSPNTTVFSVTQNGYATALTFTGTAASTALAFANSAGTAGMRGNGHIFGTFFQGIFAGNATGSSVNFENAAISPTWWVDGNGNQQTQTITIGTGTYTVYRCTTAGTLAIGGLTTVPADCVASVATSLAIN